MKLKENVRFLNMRHIVKNAISLFHKYSNGVLLTFKGWIKFRGFDDGSTDVHVMARIGGTLYIARHEWLK